MKAPLAAYLVKGDDPVLRAQAVRALVGELVGEGDASLMVEDHAPGADDDDTAAVAEAAGTPPFLSERRVVVARDVTSYRAEGLQPLLAYLADPLSSTSVVLVGGDGGRVPKRLADAVSRVGRVIDTSAPSGRARGDWLASQLRHAPVRLEPAAVALLQGHLGEDVGRLSSMVEAVASAYGVGASVGADDLRPFLGEAGSIPPWELTDAIDGGDAAAALGGLHRLLAAGERHGLQVMAVLHNHYGRLLRLDGAAVDDEAGAGAALGLRGSTFPARKALTQSRRLGHENIARAIGLLAEADLDLRGRKGWPDDLVLDVLVARLCRLTRRPRSQPRAGRRRRG